MESSSIRRGIMGGDVGEGLAAGCRSGRPARAGGLASADASPKPESVDQVMLARRVECGSAFWARRIVVVDARFATAPEGTLSETIA